MDYLALLTADEKEALCEVISGKKFKDFFIKDDIAFRKLKKGFRACKLSEEEALKIALDHIDDPIIENFMNKEVTILIKGINAYNHEKYGVALAQAAFIIKSSFANDIDLYLKLTEHDEEKKKLFCEAIDIANEFIKINEENKALKEKIKDYEQKEQKLITLASPLTDKKNEPSKGQKDYAAVSSHELLAQFDDTDAELLPSAEDKQIVSLCERTTDASGPLLYRHADLKPDGCYHLFRKDADLPPLFNNRPRIFSDDVPIPDGFCAVWTWSTVPNQNDPARDYVSSKYSSRLDPIEIVVIPGAASLKDLAGMLKNGIDFLPRSSRVLFAFKVRKQYTGILCTANELSQDTAAGKTALASSFLEAPVYKFTQNEILVLDNGLAFYKKAFAGIPIDLYPLKSRMDIVKDIVLESLSWSVHKARGVRRIDHQAFTDLLKSIPDNDILQKIESTCHCSTDEADDLLNKFKAEAVKYIKGESLEDDILRSVLSVDDGLQERAKKLIRDDWEKENAEELNKLRQENNKERETLAKLKQEQKQAETFLADKEKLAEDVEKAVNARIQKARAKAADFIAEMAFVGGQPPVQAASAEPAAIAAPAAVQDAPAAATATGPACASCTAGTAGTSPYKVFPASNDASHLKVHYCWDDVLGITAGNLRSAGVAEEHLQGLAAFLCASYREKQPLLLVGPNAIDIAQAFSAAAAACKYGRLCCDGSCTSGILDSIGADNEKIVLINNLFASSWMNRLPEILGHKEVFSLVTHPYAEDIQVEPKSLYSFMLPLFTEFFVDKEASGSYDEGCFADSFKDCQTNAAQNDFEVLSHIELTPLVRNKLSKVLAAMHGISDKTTIDDEVRFAVLPVSYATLQITKLTELGSALPVSQSLADKLQHIALK